MMQKISKKVPLWVVIVLLGLIAAGAGLLGYRSFPGPSPAEQECLAASRELATNPDTPPCPTD
jgi:hypothetical protein